MKTKVGSYLRGLRIILVLAIGAGVVLYFQGLWIPNYPSESKFPVRGIDVSHHQDAIRWNEINPDVIHFAYLKATEGGDFRDTQFSKNWKAAREAGIPRGAYHFFTLKRPGIEQAANYIAVVPKESDTLPPAIDLEFWGNSSARPSVEDFRRELEAFMVEIREHYGREPVIYTDTKFKKHYLKDYPIQRLWIRAVIFTPEQASAPDWTFWQFSEKMKVKGIDGFVDQNVFQGDETAFRKLIEETL